MVALEIKSLRRVKTAVRELFQLGRGARICERNSCADTKASKAGVRGGAPGTEVGIPLQPMVQTMVRPSSGNEDKNANCVLGYKKEKHEKCTYRNRLKLLELLSKREIHT